jgi:ABC-type sugar transport system ATPase subunit
VPDILLTDVGKTFPGGVVGLYPTTLHVRSGEHFVLLGPSGSGKTTLLRLVAGLETPDRGTIAFDGSMVHGLPPHQRGLSFVAQATALYPDRDVRGNVAIGLELGPRSSRPKPAEIEARVREAAELLSIDRYLSARPHELSGGEQRRVVLARAVVRRAAVWLLDEPLSHLDSALSAKLIQDLHLLQSRFGLTIVHVTHDPNDALATADRVGMLGGGRIIQSGTPDELYTRPGSRTVGLHFGRPPINLLDGRGDGKTFISASGRYRVPGSPDGPVTFGVRPEDVRFTPGDGWLPVGAGPVLDVRRYDGRFMIAVGGPDEAIRGLGDGRPAGTTGVWVRADRLHWFDPATGDRLPGDTTG